MASSVTHGAKKLRHPSAIIQRALSKGRYRERKREKERGAKRRADPSDTSSLYLASAHKDIYSKLLGRRRWRGE
jgi:hypothetical protein